MKRIAVILIGWLVLASQAFAQSDDSGKILKDSIFHYYDCSNFERVVELCEEALVKYEAEGNTYDMAGCYNILGNAQQRMGRFSEAIASYEHCTEALEQLKASENESDQSNAARVYDRNLRYMRNNIAEVFIAIGEYEQAERIYHDCIENLGTPKDTMDYRDLATYKQNLADVYMRQAEIGKEGVDRNVLLQHAVEMAELSVELSRRYDKLPFKRVSKEITLGQAYHAIGRLDEAKALATNILTQADSLKDDFLLSESHALLGSIDASMGQYRSSENHLKKAVEIASENHFDVLQMTTLKEAYEASKHFDKGLALGYLENLVVLKDSMFSEKRQQIIREYQVKYDLSEKEFQLELEKANNRRSRFTIITLFVITMLLLALFILVVTVGIQRKRNAEVMAKVHMAKDQLFTIVSHDFKTSVLSQNLMLDLINRHYSEMNEADIKSHLSQLKLSSDMLKNNMASLIEWVKTELGGDMINATTFNVRALVENCISSQEAVRQKKQLTIVNTVDGSLTASDNENMAKLILRNLLNNAMKYSHTGGEVKVEAKEEGKRVWLSVTDHGEGFSPQFLETFAQGCLQSSGELGSGIGLMLSKQVLERGGGKLVIESKKGEGATVRFTIKK